MSGTITAIDVDGVTAEVTIDVHTLDTIIRVGYPIAIAAVVGLYWMRFYA